MPTKYTVTLSSMGTSYVIAIPKPIVEGFGMVKGQKLDLIVRDDGIHIPITENAIGSAPSPTMVSETMRKYRHPQQKARRGEEEKEVTPSA